MAYTYSTGCKLPRNHNLPQGCPRLWEWQHPKTGNVRDFDSTVRRVYELYVPNSLWTHGPNMDGTYSLGPNLPWNHNLPQGSPSLWDEGTPNLGIYASPVCYYWGIGATSTIAFVLWHFQRCIFYNLYGFTRRLNGILHIVYRICEVGSWSPWIDLDCSRSYAAWQPFKSQIWFWFKYISRYFSQTPLEFASI